MKWFYLTLYLIGCITVARAILRARAQRAPKPPPGMKRVVVVLTDLREPVVPGRLARLNPEIAFAA